MLKFSINDLSVDSTGKIGLKVPMWAAESLQKLQSAISGGKRIDVELKVHREARSLNANAALWAMMGDIAKVLGSTADEVYLKMLELYGVYRFIAIYPEDYDAESRCHRIVRQQGWHYSGDYRFMVLQVWDGSSGYDTAQFARLLDGVISEAKDLGIPFLSAADRALVMDGYAKEVSRVS